MFLARSKNAAMAAAFFSSDAYASNLAVAHLLARQGVVCF